MATTTPRKGLRKPSGTDLVNVTTDISANMDILDRQPLSPVLHKIRASVNHSLSVIAWTDMDNTLDLTFAAGRVQVGDWVEILANFSFSNEAPVGFLDAVSIVTGNPVNSWSGVVIGAGSAGLPAWVGDAGVYHRVGGGGIKQVVAGDLDAGVLLLRLRRRNSSAAAKVVEANAGAPFQWWAKNLGQ